MGKSRIQGITIQLDGETKGLQAAMKEVNKQSVDLTSELKDVDRLLKFNPGNTEAIAQKQKLLGDQIAVTAEKLNVLKGAEADVQAQFDRGDMGEEQYRAFRREIEFTEGALNGYKGALSKIQSEQENLTTNTQRLDTLFDATGSSVDDFSDILGTQLVNSIKKGTATSDQLEQAINKIGRASLGADTDIGKMKTALDQVDNGSSLQDVQGELRELSSTADESADALENIGDSLGASNMLEGAEALGGVADKVKEIASVSFENAMDIDALTSKFNNAFGLTGKEAEATKDKIVDLYNSGIAESYDEAAEALQQTKQQLKEVNDADLGDITGKALNFTNTFGGDVAENLRGVNSLMNVYGLTANQAFDLMTVGAQNGLNKTDELGDNLAEYATLFEENGYSASEMFNILQSGLDGGAYNLDKVNDLVKEFGVRISDGTIEGAVTEIGGSFKTLFDEWKASGGSNKDLFQSISQELMGVQDETEKASLVSQIFGSLGEDAGFKIIESMGDVANETNGVKTQYDDAAGAADKLMEASDSQSLTAMWRELQDMLRPIGEELMRLALEILPVIVGAFKNLKEWFDRLNPVVQEIIKGFGLFGGIVVILTPIAVAIGGLVLAFMALDIAMLPIIAVIAGIAAVITVIILVIKNWGAITDWLKEKWNDLSQFLIVLWEIIKLGAEVAWNAIVDFFVGLWNGTIETAKGIWNGLGEFFSGLWTGIKETASSIWNGLIDFLVGLWNGIIDTGKGIWNGLGEFLGGLWDGIKSKTASAWKGIKDAIMNPINDAKDAVKKAIDAMKDFFNFNWKLPSIKMPHFSVSGSANPIDWIKKGVPKINVDWFAKGGILTKPTAFGMNGNSIMAGGEAGKEAVAPISTLMSYVRQAVAEANGSNQEQMVELLRALVEKNMNVYLNEDQLVGFILDTVDRKLANKGNDTGVGSGRAVAR